MDVACQVPPLLNTMYTMLGPRRIAVGRRGIVRVLAVLAAGVTVARAQLVVTNAVSAGNGLVTQLGAPWNGTVLQVFDAVEPRHEGFGDQAWDLKNVELVLWSKQDTVKYCEEGVVDRSKFSPGRVLLLSQEVNDHAIAWPSCDIGLGINDWSMYWLRILPRVIMSNAKGRFAGFGTYKLQDMPFKGGLMVGQNSRDWQAFEQNILDYAATRSNEEFIILQGNITTQLNHFASFLKSPFVLAIQQYGACLAYIYLGLFAVRALLARRSQPTPLEITVILYGNAFLNTLLALAHALDGASFVSPGMPYAWTGFFRLELGSQVIALDYLLVVVWDRVLELCLNAKKGVSIKQTNSVIFKKWGVAALLSLYGWVIDVLNADLGVRRRILLILPSFISIVQMVVALTLWSKSKKLLQVIEENVRACSSVIDAKNTFQQRQKMFLKRVAWAGKLSAVSSFASVSMLGFSALFYFSSPWAMFLVQTALVLARLGNSYAQILFCIRDDSQRERKSLLPLTSRVKPTTSSESVQQTYAETDTSVN